MAEEYLFLFGIPACAQFCQTLILCDRTVALESDKGHMPVQTEVTFQKIRSVSDLETTYRMKVAQPDLKISDSMWFVLFH